jgi:dTDP-4-amino-4,6-dideoxygalactose transaminase
MFPILESSNSTPMKYKIPFNKPCFAGMEQSYIAQAIANGHVSGDGPFTKKCSELLESLLSVPKVLLTTSCTHALEIAAILLNVQEGDEVIVPSFTFVSTVNAFVLRGAKPVFVDIRPDTLNLDESLILSAITERTKAIVPVHYAGVGCEMNTISSICQKNEIHIVEDNAHGLFGKYDGKLLGTFGTFGAQSFHETKNFQCGEGGALLINDPVYVERAEIVREKGTNRSKFFRGQIDKYNWVDIGSSYLPSDLLAAFLLAQLEERQAIQNRRRTIWKTYRSQLGDWAVQRGIALPVVPENCEQSYHMFYLLLPSLSVRQRLIEHLASNGILAVYHYLSLHGSPMGQRFGYKLGDCPVTESISDRLLRLPFFNNMTEVELQQVINAVLQFS